MFAVIYRGFVKPHQEDEYQRFWKIIATYFVNERGALGSTLHRAEDGMWVAYSLWPEKAKRDASWPSENEKPNSEIPENIRLAIKGLKECLKEQLPEICMEVKDQFFFSCDKGKS